MEAADPPLPPFLR